MATRLGFTIFFGITLWPWRQHGKFDKILQSEDFTLNEKSGKSITNLFSRFPFTPLPPLRRHYILLRTNKNERRVRSRTTRLLPKCGTHSGENSRNLAPIHGWSWAVFLSAARACLNVTRARRTNINEVTKAKGCLFPPHAIPILRIRQEFPFTTIIFPNIHLCYPWHNTVMIRLKGVLRNANL